jgi:type IX secretion system PorP/SprF family membrane protein
LICKQILENQDNPVFQQRTANFQNMISLRCCSIQALSRFCLTIVLLITSFISLAQDLPVYNQYMLNRFLLNPAVVGSEKCNSMAITDRHQWIGIAEAPYTQTFSFMARAKRKHGWGIILKNDQNGPNKNMGFQLSYAYHMTLNKRKVRKIAFGASFLADYTTLDESRFIDADGDPIITGAIITAFTPDANTGIYFYSRKMYAGITIARLLPIANAMYKSGKEPLKTRNYFLFIARKFTSKKKKTVIEPSIVLKGTEKLLGQLDINVKVSYLKHYWFAISYRRSIDMEASNPLSLQTYFGIKFEQLTIAYAFDVGLTKIQYSNLGSHEVLIGYRFCREKSGAVPCPIF